MTILNSKVVRQALDWENVLKESTSAGNDKSFTVPSGKEWRLQTARVDYTGAVGSTGDRQLVFQYQSSAGNTLYEAIAPQTQNNSTGSAVIRNYDFSPEVQDSTDFRDTSHLVISITTPVLPQNYKFRLFDNASNSTTDTLVVRALVQERDEPSSST